MCAFSGTVYLVLRGVLFAVFLRNFPIVLSTVFDVTSGEKMCEQMGIMLAKWFCCDILLLNLFNYRHPPVLLSYNLCANDIESTI